MKDYGRIICIMEEANCGMHVVISMKENLWMIWLKDSGSIIILMEVNTLAIGIRINSMDLEKKNGMMEAIIKDFIKMLQKKDKVNIYGQMVIDILESGIIICSTEKAFLFGMIKDNILVNGKII